MTAQGFKIIDAHQHFETGSGLGEALTGASGAAPLSAAERARLELDTRLGMMDAEGVDGAVILPGSTYLRPRGLEDTRAVNDAVAAYCRALPQRFVAAVGVLEPLYGPAGHAEARRCRHELGMCGVAFHNAFQGVPIDSPLMRPLIERIGAAGLVPFIHVIGSAFETIWQVDALAQDFPDLPMVVLDAFHDINGTQHLRTVAERRPNLVFDLALLVSFDAQALPLVRALGARRFVYGTDQYSWPLMRKPFGNTLQGILESDLPAEDKQAVLSGNIRRLLALQ